LRADRRLHFHKFFPRQAKSRAAQANLDLCLKKVRRLMRRSRVTRAYPKAGFSIDAIQNPTVASYAE